MAQRFSRPPDYQLSQLSNLCYMGKIGYLHLPIIYRRCFNEIRLENLTLLSDHVYIKLGHPDGTRTHKFHLERVMTVTYSSTGRYIGGGREDRTLAHLSAPNGLANRPLHHLGTPPLLGGSDGIRTHEGLLQWCCRPLRSTASDTEPISTGVHAEGRTQ